MPYLSSIAFGEQSSEHLAALDELCGWSGGLSLNVDVPVALRPAAEGLSQHLFGDGSLQGTRALDERRAFYSKKQGIGKCFLNLPSLSSRMSSSSWTATNSVPTDAFDGAVPSEAILTILSDVSFSPPRRWSRSLRCWRMHRALRDVVFSEPGGLGLELDEPQVGDSEPSKRSWRLKATHPPASALKLEEQSELVAVNLVRVHRLTQRSEIARRVAARPVCLTFRTPNGTGDASLPFGGAMLAMAVAEVAVAELREGFGPIKTNEPPLCEALQRVAAAASSNIRQRQASRILLDVAKWGSRSSCNPPVWAASLAEGHAVRRRLERPDADLFLSEPSVLFRALMFSGDLVTVARLGLTCTCCRRLVSDRAWQTSGTQRDAAPRRTQQRLWKWILCWGHALHGAQRVGFWRWSLRRPASADSAKILDAAAEADSAGFLELSRGLGASLGELGGMMSDRISSVVGAGTLTVLLGEPLHAQRLWLLTSSGLPWLVLQGRWFQITLAAHHPQLFRHLFCEGLAPELFYCWWLQSLLQGIVADEDVVRLWDLLVFERSYKVLVRAAVALLGLLEQRLVGRDLDSMMGVLFSPAAWDIPAGAVFAKTLETKVTRKMLRRFQELDAPPVTMNP